MQVFKKYKPLTILFSSLIVISLFISMTDRPSQQKLKPVVIGYVGGYRGLVNAEEIDARKLTHINYAFVDVKNNQAFLTNEKTDTVNFRKLNNLKKINPELKILISIGGWSWSENFSDAVLSDASRKTFAVSAVNIIKKNKLDGVDIDWEYPGMPGEEGNIYRPEDKQNFTLMFQALRKELDILEKQDGKKKLLTTAVAGFASFLDHTEMGKAGLYLDYVNLMTYDLFSGDTAVHHAGLYATSMYKSSKYADHAVKAFMAAGVPASKLVLGIPFYGRSFKLNADAKKGIGDKRVSQEYLDGYTLIKDSLVNKKGFKVYRDDAAKVPYLFNASTKEVISYDDEKSVRDKCLYVMNQKMAGVMFWEYSSDSKGYLLSEIHKTLK